MGILCFMFNSSGEPPTHPGVSDSCVPGGSETDFKIGCITSCKKGANATMNASLDHDSSMC